ncbi:MAG: uroporphyrinogen-III synthase [Actinomycetota bacterium]|nr:uroporphyrinogen-III synthase [Actinomycetota bacterium]
MERTALCDGIPALAGHRVGITGDRRAEEQAELLRRLGAEVVHGPVLRTLPLGDESVLRAATDAVLADPPSVTILNTGIGLRAWIGAAETWGVADALVAALAGGRVLARGPKAYAAAVQVGLRVWHQEPSERLDLLVAGLSGELQGEHVAFQLHGDESPEIVAALEQAGARVTPVAVYRWEPRSDEGPARRLVRETVDGQLSAVTFTSPSAVASACRIAEADGSRREFVEAFRHRVVAACVGPVTRDAALELGIAVACSPELGRLGLLVRSLATTLRSQHLHLGAEGREYVVQGRLLMDGERELSLADRERQVFNVLARRAGAVVARASIEQQVWKSTEEDRALDAVLSRLRRHLAPTGLEVATRHRRGYQLLAEPLPCPALEPRDRPIPVASAC